MNLWQSTTAAHDHDGLKALCARSTFKPDKEQREKLVAVAGSCVQCGELLSELSLTPEEKAAREQQKAVVAAAKRAAEAAASLMQWHRAVEAHDHKALERLCRESDFKPNKEQREELLANAASCEHCRKLWERVRTRLVSCAEPKFKCPKCQKVMVLTPDELFQSIYGCPYCESSGSTGVKSFA